MFVLKVANYTVVFEEDQTTNIRKLIYIKTSYKAVKIDSVAIYNYKSECS